MSWKYCVYLREWEIEREGKKEMYYQTVVNRQKQREEKRRWRDRRCSWSLIIVASGHTLICAECTPSHVMSDELFVDVGCGYGCVMWCVMEFPVIWWVLQLHVRMETAGHSVGDSEPEPVCVCVWAQIHSPWLPTLFTLLHAKTQAALKPTVAAGALVCHEGGHMGQRSPADLHRLYCMWE